MKPCKKRSYKDKIEALLVLRGIMKKEKHGTKKHVPNRVYLCDICNKWHLTHMENEVYINTRAKDVDLVNKDAWQLLLENE